MRVFKWGHSLAIRLPAAVVEALELREGDDVTLRASGLRMIEVEKMPSAKPMLARLRKFRGRLPEDFKLDRLEANERH
jgi:antitoxin MazE